MIDQTLYYVVRAAQKLVEPYSIWEMTAEAMAERVEKDSTLVKRLERAPLKTRAEAEKGRNELQ